MNVEGNIMVQCKDCRKDIKENYMLVCPNCGATMCEKCAKKNMNICQYCYSDLDYKQF